MSEHCVIFHFHLEGTKKQVVEWSLASMEALELTATIVGLEVLTGQALGGHVVDEEARATLDEMLKLFQGGNDDA